jgi:hypothetical protein
VDTGITETIEGRAELWRAEDGVRCAAGQVSLWIQPPTAERPGRWGGRLALEQVEPALRPIDFAFVLRLADGRTAQTFADIDLERGWAVLDGNGPPPA